MMVFTGFGIVATICVFGAAFVGTAWIVSETLVYMEEWKK